MSSTLFINLTHLTLTAAAINLSVPLLLTLPLWISFYSAILKYNDFIKSKEWRNSDANIPEVFDFIIGKRMHKNLWLNYSIAAAKMTQF